MTWQTEPPSEGVTLAGQVTAKLFAATTGRDADWVVKLIDVYPEANKQNWKLPAYELMIAEEIFRGRYRQSYEKPEPIIPNRVTPFTIDLHTASHVFEKGHRIMVQVQSTWFPLYDRNPQRFVPNVFEAKESDFQKATQTIYRSAKHPSALVPICARTFEIIHLERVDLGAGITMASNADHPPGFIVRLQVEHKQFIGNGHLIGSSIR